MYLRKKIPSKCPTSLGLRAPFLRTPLGLCFCAALWFLHFTALFKLDENSDEDRNYSESILLKIDTEQKKKFSIQDFFSKYDQIYGKLRIWSHSLKKSVMKNFIFCAVCSTDIYPKITEKYFNVGQNFL